MIEFDGAASAPVSEKTTKPEKRSPVKNDPKLIVATRELRGRYLEAVNTDPTPPSPNSPASERLQTRYLRTWSKRPGQQPGRK